ncbi:hypothetical protein D0Z00_004571 [Geotrichum galactomycetum]|uniref:Uncharacterized protein n=1 Tax=Geotrichum galactomycetum TaxID=27317 RepID=A0ACB6UY16_9ASCO|nr:hypothetical protein D0Z00_004571 [Geotrichum candidum]
MLAQRLIATSARAAARASTRRSTAFLGLCRPISTVSTTDAEALEILKKQRANRPISPHLTIYKPEITMILSGLHRITGVALAGTFYLYALSYVALPAFGYTVDAASMAAAFGSLPLAFKIAIKTIAAAPFSLHFWNGFRHLLWDSARQLTVKGVWRTGYAVIGLSAVSTLALAIAF